MPTTIRIVALLLLASTACSDEALETTQVMVLLDASDALAASASRLVVVVYDSDGEVAHSANLALGSEVELPASIPVVPRGGDASRTFTLEAILLDSADATLSRVSLSEGFEENAFREVPVTFPETLEYATTPPDTVVVESFDATGIGVTEIAGASLSVAAPADEHSVVLVSAQLRGPGGLMGPVVELTIDGEVFSRGQSATYQGQSLQLVGFVEGDGMPHTVSLRFNSTADRDYSIADVRMFAFQVPRFADLRVSRLAGQAVVDPDWTRVVEIDFEPAYAGDYVVLMGAGISESPGGSGVNVRLDGPSGQYPRSTSFSFGREPILPVMLARVERLEARPTIYAVAARAAAGSSASAWDPIVILMRADAFPRVLSTFDSTDVVARGPSETLAPLTLDAQDVGSHWLTISDSVVSANNADSNGVTSITYDRDGVEVAERTRGSIGSDTTTMSHIDAFETSAPTLLESALSPVDGTLESRAHETSVVAIRF